jgi:hypothetical protein
MAIDLQCRLLADFVEKLSGAAVSVY